MSGPRLIREDCSHDVLHFGSGDYYVFCRACGASWVCVGPGSDKAEPGLANRGKGALLSGHGRCSLAKIKESLDLTRPGTLS